MRAAILERPVSFVGTGLTEAEYFAINFSAEQRSEFLEGELFAMPGGTEERGTEISIDLPAISRRLFLAEIYTELTLLESENES